MKERTTAMKVRVDPTRCHGHARCAVLAPETFKLDEWGHSYVEQETVPVPLQEATRRAVAGCPEHAITIEGV
jgi:ferredoxin